MSKEKPMRRLTIMIPEELVAGLEDVAEVSGGNISDVLRDAVTAYLFKGPWGGIGGVAKKAILAGKTNEEALADVLAAHPSAATSLRSISWYRADLRKEHGEAKVLTDAAVKRMRERSSEAD
jgi:hypothetical protein